MTDLLSSTSSLVLALVLTNSGGEGKSTFTETFAAIARLSGLETIVADVDPGNRGYLNRNGDNSALSLSWSQNGTNNAPPPDPEAWFNQHVSGRQLAILDTGANMLAAGGWINAFIGKLIQIARERGARIVIFGVTSPNKAGSEDLIELIYERFRRAAEVVVVQNDRDGSTQFSESLALLGRPIVNLPHLMPGLQAVRLRRRIPLDEVLTNPELGYERATALIAKGVARVAVQDTVVEIIGINARERFVGLAASAPGQIFYNINKLRDATNTIVDANELHSTAWQAFNRADINDVDRFRQASISLHNARTAWLALQR